MRLRDHYDWIVLGNNPGALLSASLAARLGLSVLVLPMTPNWGVSVSKKNHYFDPEPNYLLGLGRSGSHFGLVYECLSRLGISEAEADQIGSATCLPQVLTPRSRFVLARNEDLSYELQREFGHRVAHQFGLDEALKKTESEYLDFWKSLPQRLTLRTQKILSSPEGRDWGAGLSLTSNLTSDSFSTSYSHPSSPLTLKDLRRNLRRKLHRSDRGMAPWIKSNQTVSEWVAKLGATGSTDLENVCTGLWYAVTSCSPGAWNTKGTSSDPTLFDLLHILALSRTGGSFRGGMTAYREFLLRLAKRYGVHVEAEAVCRRIFVEQGRFVGIQITGRGHLISTRGGILGCSLEKAYARVTYTGYTGHTGKAWRYKKAHKKAHENKKSPVPIGWRFTLSITIPKDTVLPKMLPRAIWQEKDAPILELEMTNPSDYGAYNPTHQILHLRSLMPMSAESLNTDYQKSVAGRMVRQAMEIVPFLETLIFDIYPDFRNQHQNEMQKLYGFSALQDIPDNLLVYTGKGLGSETGIEGLFIASEESYPELGSLGPAVAATEGVAWLAHRSGLAGPWVESLPVESLT